jgi:hypothetical protein
LFTLEISTVSLLRCTALGKEDGHAARLRTHRLSQNMTIVAMRTAAKKVTIYATFGVFAVQRVAGWA